MAEDALINSERNEGPKPDSEATLFHRRIDFHLARKQFSGFGNSTSNGFKLVTLNPNSGTQQESGSGRKSENSERLESGLDPELGLEITFRRIGAGLRNLGNTCFLNSVLQCLTYTEPLAAYLQSGKHQISCRTAGFCALCAIQKHVSRALQSTGRILEPKDLVSNLRCISRNFRNARQEDAHEYMVNLLESMHKCCLASGVPSESPGAYEKSLVHRIFGGRLRSQVKCMQCSFCSNKFDPFLDLSLEIFKADSLQKALAHFTAKEQLDGGAKQYQCQQCKQKVKALKQLTIYKAPHVLTVHLKRFSSHVHGQKIDKKIAFGSTLDLKPFVSGPSEGDLNYTLYGVLVHTGWSTHSGHYYCFVRTSTGMWYSLDDNQVVQVSERKVLEQKAYMLFYVRDRQNFCRKKPVGFLTKESLVTNALGKAACSKFNMNSNEKVHNGLTDNNLDASFSATSSKRGALAAPALKETPLEKIPLQNSNSSMVVGCLDHKRDPLSEPLPASLMNHSLKDPPSEPLPVALMNHSLKDLHVMNDNKVVQEAESCSNNEGSSGNFNSAKTVDHNKNLRVGQSQNLLAAVVSPEHNMSKDSLSKKDSGDFVALPSTCSEDCTKETSTEPVDQLPNSNTSCTSSGDMRKMDEHNSEMCDRKSSCIQFNGTNMEASNKVNSVKSSNQNCSDDYLVGGVPQKSDDSTSIQETCDLKGVQFKLSGLLPPTENLSCVTAKSKHSQLKVKKRHFKCRAATMSLSSNIIFGGIFSMRKKKHKPRKQHSIRKRPLNVKDLFGGNDLPSDNGQSASDRSLTLPINHSSTRSRKKIKCGSNDKCQKNDEGQKINGRSVSCNGSISSDIIYNDLRERVVLGGASLAVENQPQSTQSAAQGPGNSENGRESRQIDVMSMLTRGLEETTVARWEGIDVSLSEKTEAGVAGTTQIGYIGDEWDEEYDRGKQKKIRSSNIRFGGPNLFQEIASKNSRRKRVKLDQSSSENPPFRI